MKKKLGHRHTKGRPFADKKEHTIHKPRGDVLEEINSANNLDLRHLGFRSIN
jgi:hypothetical protein